MSSATTTNQLPLLTRLFGNKLAEPFYKKSDLLNKITKDTTFGSEGRHVAVSVSPTTGGSATYSDAAASMGASQDQRFFVTHRKEYQLWSIQNDLIARTNGDKNAIVSAVKKESERALLAFWRRMSRRLWGNAGGAIGQLASTVTTSTTAAQLRTRTDILGLENGYQLAFATDDGSATSPAGVLGAPTYLTASAIVRSTGSFTTSAAMTTVSGITANCYVFQRGDYSIAMTGIRGWNPIADPTGGESFMGVDRTLYDINRVSGVRYTASGGSKEESLIAALTECNINGITVDRVSVNPLQFRDILFDMGAKRERTSTKDSGISFQGIEVYGPDGPVEVVAEADVPAGYAWFHNTEDLALRTAGPCPSMLNQNGGLRDAAADDAKEGRIGCYGNFFNENPGNCLIMTW